VRARSCETWLPVWRLVASAHGTSQALEERVEGVRASTRCRLELMYRPELDTLSEPARNAVLIALEALTGLGLLGPHARALRPLLRPGL
jgi:hypothetical protein